MGSKWIQISSHIDHRAAVEYLCLITINSISRLIVTNQLSVQDQEKQSLLL